VHDLSVGQIVPSRSVYWTLTKRSLNWLSPSAPQSIGRHWFSIQRHVEANGFSVVREYTGHGLGDLHEAPTVLQHAARQGMKIRSGMVFTIEPMSERRSGPRPNSWPITGACALRCIALRSVRTFAAITDNGAEI